MIGGCRRGVLPPRSPVGGVRTLQKSRINFRESVIKTMFPRHLKQGPSPPGPLFPTVVRGKHRMRHPGRALFRVTALAALLAFPARALADAAPDPDEAVDQITQMNRDAVTAYQAKKYEDARKILKQALDLASSAGLDKHPIKARTHIHLGVVIIVGFKQRDLGIKQFKKAIEIQSDIGLTKALGTPELTDAFNEAKGTGGPTPPPPATPPEPPPPPKPATPP